MPATRASSAGATDGSSMVASEVEGREAGQSGFGMGDIRQYMSGADNLPSQ